MFVLKFKFLQISQSTNLTIEKMDKNEFSKIYFVIFTKKLSRNENERLIRPPRDPDFPP